MHQTIKVICIKGCGDITIALVKPIHFLESIMVSVKALAIVLSVLVICEAKWDRASKQEVVFDIFYLIAIKVDINQKKQDFW